MGRLTTIILTLLIIGLVLSILATFNYHSLRNLIDAHFTKSSGPTTEKQYTSNNKLQERCDENKLILQLAQLYVVSPESILLLLTNKSLRTTCQEISDVLLHINATLSNSRPLPQGNLYVQLYNGLNYFNSVICLQSANSKEAHLTNFHDCIRELREDFIECEGPPDWFEKTNEAVACQYFNDIVNCLYTKAAMLCGLEPALMLKSFSTKIMKEVVTFKCKLLRSLPHIDDPMPATSYYLRSYYQFPALLMSLLCCICSLLMS